MARVRNPRYGSMQFWPRKRAKRQHARIRSWAKAGEALLLGFAGYKVGMAHAMVTDNRKNSLTKGESIAIPVTIVECPNLFLIGLNAYKKGDVETNYSLFLAKTLMAEKRDKNVKRSIKNLKKAQDFSSIDSELGTFSEIRALACTQPYKTGIGKKKPEIFELALGGSAKDQLDFLKKNFGKEISVKDVLKEGQQVDVHAVTKGKGVQGPVRRFGVSLRSHKSEKTKRGPGSLGPWKSQAHVMYRVAHAGQTGYHLRTIYNNLIVKIDEKLLSKDGGFHHYGVIKNPYVMIKGSLPGPKKRLVKLVRATRPNHRVTEAPEIEELVL